MAFTSLSTLDQPEEEQLYAVKPKLPALGTVSPTVLPGADVPQTAYGTLAPPPTTELGTVAPPPLSPSAPNPTPVPVSAPALSYGEAPQAASYGTVAPSGPTDLSGGGMYATGGTLAMPNDGYGTVSPTPGIQYGGTSGIINDSFGAPPPQDPSALISSWYDQYLHRAPEQAGLDSWLQAYGSYGPEGVEAGIRNSPEAQAYLAQAAPAAAPVGAQPTAQTAAPATATPQSGAQAPARDPNAILSALYPQMPATQPFTATADLRATQINPTASSATTAAQGMTDTAAQGLAGFNGLTGYSPVNATDDPYTARADALSDEAAGMARSADIGPQQSIAGTDLTQSRGLLDQALGQVGGMAQGPRYNVAGTDLSGAYGTLDRAEQGLGGVFAPSAEATSARSTALGNLNSLNDTPNRADLAARAFDLIQQRGQPGYEQDLRRLGAKEAALGRIGSGMTEGALSDYSLKRQRDLDLTRQELANSAAGMELGDRESRLSSALGAMGAFGGEDRSNYGVNLSRSGALGSLAGQRAGLAQITRGDNEADRAYNSGYDQYGNDLTARRYGMFSDSADRATNYANTTRANAESDRAYNFDYGNARASNRLAQGGFLSGLSDRAFGQGQSLRNETRDEQTRDQQGQMANLNAKTGIFGTLANYQNQLYGQDAASRTEMRGERGYQNDLAQQGFTNAFNSAQLNDSLTNSASNRYNDQTRLLMGAMGDPNALASALLNSSNQQSGTAQQGMGDVGTLLALWSQMQAGRSPTTTGSNTFPTSWAAGG